MLLSRLLSCFRYDFQEQLHVVIDAGSWFVLVVGLEGVVEEDVGCKQYV